MRSRARIGSHPLHPMLIGLPIGLWVGSLAFDLFGRAQDSPAFHAAGYYAAILGCIGALLAAVPGTIDWLSVVPPKSSAKATGAIHGILNVTVLVLFAIVAWQRRGPAPGFNGFPHGAGNPQLLLSIIGVLLLAVSGWLGGTLAYDHQIGVARHYPQSRELLEREISSFDRPICNQSELADGQMMLVHLTTAGHTKRVVVGKTTEGFYAFNDHCTHQGGPLCDGALAGTTVQCPWHGSQFDVRTGRVVAGPAKTGIEIFTVAQRGSEIYLENTGTTQTPIV